MFSSSRRAWPFLQCHTEMQDDDAVCLKCRRTSRLVYLASQKNYMYDQAIDYDSINIAFQNVSFILHIWTFTKIVISEKTLIVSGSIFAIFLHVKQIPKAITYFKYRTFFSVKNSNPQFFSVQLYLLITFSKLECAIYMQFIFQFYVCVWIHMSSI